MNVFLLLFLEGCSNTRVLVEGTKRIIIEDDTQNNRSEKVSIKDNEFTQGHFKIGNPYIINNIKYIPKLVSNYDEEGIASWYGPKFHKKLTANGEVFDQNKVSAAHKTLPLPSIVKVKNLSLLLSNGSTAIIIVVNGHYNITRIAIHRQPKNSHS